MKTEGLEKYSFARHRYIETGRKLFVLQSDDVLTKVRYEANGVFYTETFNTDELKKHEKQQIF